MELHKQYFAQYPLPGPEVATTVKGCGMKTEACSGESSTGSTSFSDDINIGSSKTSNAASEKAKAQREGAVRDGEPSDGLVDGSRDTATGPGGWKGEL